jgi:hypothetical protein
METVTMPSADATIAYLEKEIRERYALLRDETGPERRKTILQEIRSFEDEMLKYAAGPRARGAQPLFRPTFDPL